MAKEIIQSVSVREFAKQVGCSHPLILRLIREGKLPQNEDKTIPLKEGLIAYENRKKKTETKAAKSSSKKPNKSKKAKSNKKVIDLLPNDDEVSDSENEDENDEEELIEVSTNKKKNGLTDGKLIDALDITTQFNKARLQEKKYQAKLKEIEFKLKNGELIEKSAAVEDASKIASEVREKLMSIPVRIAALCEGKTAREIEDVMTDAIQDALISFSKSKYVGKNDEK